MSLSLRFGRGGASRDRASRPAAHHVDELTGLGSRLAFGERLERVTAPSPAGPGAVLVVDLDRFSELNDQLGQKAGDHALRVTAGRLTDSCPAGAGLYRIDGDQFALILDRGAAPDAIPLARAAFVAVQEPMVAGDHPIQVSASLAVVVIDDGPSTDEILRRAGVTVYATKAAGGRQIYAYSPELDQWATAHRRDGERLAVEVELLRSENQMLAASALVDPSTGLPNGASFAADHSQVDARRRRTGDPYAVVMVDVDWFNDYCQEAGAEAGDSALAAIASRLRGCVRPGDRAYRCGDDEFAVLLPGSSGSEAVGMAEQIRVSVQGLAIPHPANPCGVVTATVAAVEGGFRHAGTSDVLAEVGDLVLAAKGAGRNRTVWPH